MIMKLKNYFLMTLFFVSLSALAQTYEVSGIVTDDYNDPLSAVSVSVKGLQTEHLPILMAPTL